MFDRTQRRRWARTAAGVLLAGAALAGCSDSNDQQNSLKPEGPYAQQILDLFTPFFWIGTIIGIGVVVATIYVALRFREKPGEERNPKQTHGNTALEVGWTIVPALILAIMAVPTVATIFDLAEEPENAIEITVTGKQWWWEYEYVDEGIITANELHIPEDRDIALNIQSPPDGVIHSFWIPNLNGKKDAVPGRSEFLKIKADDVGEFLGQCAEYCGLSHANMRTRVFVESEEDYEKWVADQKVPVAAADVAFVEETLATKWACTECHSLNPLVSAESRTGPNLTHLGDRTTFASGMYDMNLENLTEWVYDAPEQKPAGPLKNWMPSFKDKGMTKEEAEEIAHFLLCDTATDPTVHPDCE